jgi:hypothetical protein
MNCLFLVVILISLISVCAGGEYARYLVSINGWMGVGGWREKKEKYKRKKRSKEKRRGKSKKIKERRTRKVYLKGGGRKKKKRKEKGWGMTQVNSTCWLASQPRQSVSSIVGWPVNTANQ